MNPWISHLALTIRWCRTVSLSCFVLACFLRVVHLLSLPCSFGSGEEDGEESFDDSDARRKLEEYKGSTAASASANRDQGNNRDGPSDSDENGAPQDEQDQAVEAAAEAAAAAGVTPYVQNGEVSRIEIVFLLTVLVHC